MTASEVLRNARALIEKPENWTQGAYARDVKKDGLTSPLSDQACAWCMMGAMQRCSPNDYFARQHGYELLRKLGGVEYVGEFNDTHTHAEVLSLFDRAIAAAEARGE